ncbi:MAG TPA: indolepyruvate oxidoreductase subunit beta family protein [Xanthobacteraceae bacterium]|jgi:indolepyruvate ferredoxin oxidoreductase alpha subunit|nr:indolepyruvate oxidoreductase subunit beta family protein [Xanthobacteraceae bacterium]
MERSFKKEVDALRLGAGETFRGEGILAVTKALLQSGVSYVGGYQGAPVSHLLDVMVDAEDLLADLGVHVETCTNEAAAAAMLGASINYPLRGAVTWKSIVGTNVAADALSNLASPGVIGGALIVLGEDYGEGASVIQERSYAYALKSSIWLLDPRPDLPTIVDMVEKGFELSEASHAPVMLDLRVRACHVTGEFVAKDNKRGVYSGRHRLAGPPRFEYGRLAHPPVIFTQERLKVEQRLPAAQKFIREQKLNEFIPGDVSDVGIIVLGGLTNGLLRALARLDLADLYGVSRIPIYVLNVAYPLVPDEVKDFCAGKRAVLVVEEGWPDYVEQQINVILRHADIQTRVFGKGCLPKSGDYTAAVFLHGLAAFLTQTRPPGIDADKIAADVDGALAHAPTVTAAIGDIPPRPPNFCTGCPERPVFAAIKLAQREVGPTHISADIGCHSFATFAPFSLGNSILGYGMSLASAAAVTPNMERRPIAVMGDGGFWHNGLITGVASNMFNNGDGVLIVMQNGYASATGQQYLPSSKSHRAGSTTGVSIEKTLRSLGVNWLRTVHTYSVGKMTATLKEAMRSAERGLKVIIADGECMLARQRRIRAEDAEKLKRGQRVAKARYGVDDEICTGDHSCIRLSGCPSLTVKPNPDPLRRDPVAAVVESCVGCGLCGEVAHAAVLCPSFYRADVVSNPTWWDRKKSELRRRVIAWMSSGKGLALPLSAVSQKATPPASTREVSGQQAVGSQQTTARPITILIAALGGEGGGVLTDWIIAAVASQHFPVQSTSIPGVAQRTGATTYHIEFVPDAAPEKARPILALAPGAGDVDLVVASELMEAGRAIANGFVTPDRTVTIASTSRSYLVTEKMAMADGRYDSNRLTAAVEKNSKQALLLDLEAIAQQSGAMINAVMLGAIAAAGTLPIPAEAFEAAIRSDGKAVEANLRGFRAGYEAALNGSQQRAVPAKRFREALPSLADLENNIAGTPVVARVIMTEGVRRLAAYQDNDYAKLYLDRLAPVQEADARAHANGKLLAAVARHLAVRMSYEDVIRVAQAKIDPERYGRIVRDMTVKPDQVFTVTEFLKPGVEEFCSVLPPWLARGILKLAERFPALGRAHWAMSINTASILGYLRFHTLAGLRPYRRKTFRYREEQRAIEAWLGLIMEAGAMSTDLAIEIAECANLIKGYGDTHKRGSANYRTIVEQVIEPALKGERPMHQAVDAIASARTAALVDPDGEALAKCLADLAAPPMHAIAAE